MNKEVFTPQEKDALKRLERMSITDICDMPPKPLWKLACGFWNPYVVRMIVAKAERMNWRRIIFDNLQKAYRTGFIALPLHDQWEYEDNGYNSLSAPYFEDIEYDIATNQPLVPQEEDEEEAPQATETPDKIKAELEELREQVGQFRKKEKGTALGLNQGQAALFGLAMANTFGFNYTNKKKELAPMLHKLFGWGEAKLAIYLSTPCDKEERDELANLFKDLCPPLYATIMNWGELPPEVTPEVTP